MRRLVLMLALACLALAGCGTTWVKKPDPVPAVNTAALQADMATLTTRCETAEAALSTSQSKQRDLDTAHARVLSMIKTDVSAVKLALESQCMPAVIDAIADILAVVKDANLDPERLDRWKALIDAYVKGRHDEAQAIAASLTSGVVDATASVSKLTDELAAANRALEQANRERDQAISDSTTSANQLASAVNEAKARERAELMAKARQDQVDLANTAGKYAALAAIVLAVLSYWVPFLRGIAGIAALVSASGFSLARFLGTVYADYAAWIICAVIAIVTVTYVILGMRTSDRAKMVDAFFEFGSALVPVLDDVYENKSKISTWLVSRPDATVSDFIEDQVFNKVGNGDGKMTDRAKALVHQIRAWVKQHPPGK